MSTKSSLWGGAQEGPGLLSSFAQDAQRTTEVAPKRLPAGWRETPVPRRDPFYGGRIYQRPGLDVLFSVGRWDDGRWWLHVSATAPGRVPTYEELCEVKELFIGPDRQALMIFPKRSEHVNLHPHALHFWCSLDDDGRAGLPRFGAAGSI